MTEPKYSKGESFTHPEDGEIEIIGYYEERGYIKYDCVYLDHFGSPVSPLHEDEVEQYM